jgi:trimeric autotransporter adhesin
MKSLFVPVALILASLLAACGGSGSSSNNSPTLTSIQVTPPSPSVAAGLTQQFMATGTYSNNTSQNLTTTVTWSSSNTSIASIASGGLATTKTAGGPITISASQSGVTGSASLQVTAPTLVSIAVTPATDTIPVGTFLQFTATGTYTDGSTQNLTSTASWSSSTSTVASISASGYATAAMIGSTTITATSGSVSGNTPLAVTANSLVSLEIADGDVTIADGTSHQFTALGIFNDGSRNDLTNTVTWGTSESSVATISGTGRASSVNTGMTSITASIGSISAPAVTLTVTSATLASITVGPSTRTIAPLTQLNFIAVGTFSDSSTQIITQDVTWASSATGVATVSNTAGSYGAAAGVGHGTANISAALMGVTGMAPLNVTNATLTSITLTPSTAGLATGSTLAMNAVGNFSDGTTQNISTVATWSTSSATVATVNSFGEVSGLTSGPVTITASLGGVNQNSSLTVESLTSIAVSPTTPSFANDTSYPLQATGTLADGTTQNLTGSVLWTSSNPTVLLMSVASGSKGNAVGLSAGTSTVAAAFPTFGLVTPVQVTVTSATLSSIAVTPANASIALGTPEQYKAVGTFSDSTTQTLTEQVTWTSSAVNVAIIDASGAASTTGTGSTTVSATLNGATGTTGLTVTP